MSSLYQLEYQRLSTLYSSLPPKDRQRLLRQAEDRAASLDRAIAQHIPTVIERDGDHYLVSDEVVNMYGIGETVEEAMADYRSMLVEYYESLLEDADRLSAHLRAHLELLRQIFSEEGGD